MREYFYKYSHINCFWFTFDSITDNLCRFQIKVMYFRGLNIVEFLHRIVKQGSKYKENIASRIDIFRNFSRK